MGQVFWLTGHSGAGKTTIAKGVQRALDCIILDGDEMRECISLGLSLSRNDRRENNLRVARLAKVLSRQRNVVVSVIAPMRDVRDEIDAICSPLWVYVKRTLPERNGHFYEEPDCGYFILDHDVLQIEQSVDRLQHYMENNLANS